MTTVLDHAAPTAPCTEAPGADTHGSRADGALRRGARGLVPHLAFATGAVGLTLVLFRTWLLGGLPGGVDSAFTYSSLPLFSTYGATTFSVWLPLQFGQVQQYSTYWLLSMVMSVTRSPVVTYELASVALALMSLLVLYGLVHWLTRNRVAAAVAATLYGFSPFAISQWLDGHLDVQVAIAVGPLAVWMVLLVLRTGSRAAAVGLGLCGSAMFLLTTGEGSFWLLAVLVVGLAELAALVRRDVRLAARAAWGAGIALATFVAASAVQVLPLLAGARAPFLDTSANYYVESLAVHEKYSLSFLSNVLGVPRESWLPATVNLAAVPFESLWWAIGVLVVLWVAVSSLRTRFRALGAVMLSLALAAWLLASGPSGPGGAVYRMLYDHVPYFSFLRVPNRWLMVATFAIAVATGLGVTRLSDRLAALRARHRHAALRRSVHPAARAVALVACCAALAAWSAGGILARGLPTVRPPADLVATYSSVREDPGDWRVLTTPYYQAWMPSGSQDPRLGNYETILSDLGDVSSRWTGHNVVGRGGWDPRAAQFGTYLYDTIRQGSNTRLAGLLGAAAIRYVGIDPQAASEVVAGQNEFLYRQHGLALHARHGDYAMLRNTLAQPLAYVTPTFCVVAGGLQVLGDLSAAPGFSFARTGVVFADQAAATGGQGSLARLVRDAGCVIEAPGGAASLQVLTHARSTAALSDVAPGSWARVAVNPLLDVAADPATAVLVPASGALSWRTAPLAARGASRVWVRALVGPGQGALDVEVDGRPSGRLTFAAPAVLGYQWLPATAANLSAGRHTVTLRRAGGHEVQAVATALVAGRATTWRGTGVRVVRDVNFLSPSLYADPAHARALASAAWEPIGAQVASRAPGQLSVARLPDLRSYFTIAQAPIRRPVDPAVPFGITFRGAGSGQEFYLNFFFSNADSPTVSFRFADATRATRTLYFSPQLAPITDAVPDWRHVTAVSLSTNSKAALAGGVSLLGPFSAASATHGLLGALPGAATAGSASAVARSVVGDQRVGTAATLRHVDKGLLVFTQSYAPGWHLQGAGSTAHTVGLGFANAYVVSAPAATASLSYAPAALGRVGTAASLAAWLAAAVAIALLARRRARRGPSMSLAPDAAQGPR